MKEHCITVVRIAEFAWSKFEPVEGVFEFNFFDEFMDLALAQGMHVIYHGNRRHNKLTSPKYLELVARLVTRIAVHYYQWSICQYRLSQASS